MILKSHKINQNNNFILGWYIDKNLCDDLISFFENDNTKGPGKTYGGNNISKIDKEVKDSTDLDISQHNNEPLIQKYLTNLGYVIEHYKKEYTFSDIGVSKWIISPTYNIQRYYPNQGFHQWHCERGGVENFNRHLVFMTYLNDVIDGGETEWYYQKTKVKPEKGLTVIWPADWTFTHRGLVSKTQTKYIATGWYNFYEQK
jgi:hypothetical protein